MTGPATPAAAPPAPPRGIPGRIAAFLEMVKFPHTVFALPFAACGLLLPGRGLPDLRTVLWVLAAMVGARTAAMGFNRLIDARLDAANPRTAGRALPAGTLPRGTAVAAVAIASALFLLAARELNPLCGALAFPTLGVLLGYSLAKRFTALSHFLLGLALGISPLGAWLAVTGKFAPGWTAPAALGGAVVLWVAGFDVLYACQDVESDRALGLHSIPARLGTARSLRVAAVLHALTVAALLAFGAAARLGPFFLGALAVVAVLLVVEHRLVSPDDPGRMNRAFFHLNAAVSLLVLAGVAGDLLFPFASSRWWAG